MSCIGHVHQHFLCQGTSTHCIGHVLIVTWDLSIHTIYTMDISSVMHWTYPSTFFMSGHTHSLHWIYPNSYLGPVHTQNIHHGHIQRHALDMSINIFYVGAHPLIALDTFHLTLLLWGLSKYSSGHIYSCL
jgi:hypothetical protein